MDVVKDTSGVTDTIPRPPSTASPLTGNVVRRNHLVQEGYWERDSEHSEMTGLNPLKSDRREVVWLVTEYVY